MNTYEHILTERRGGAGIITLNHPERLNSTTPNMRRELWEATEEFVADRAVRAIVYTGAGRAFCAGADVKSVFKGQLDADFKPEQGPPGAWPAFIRSLPKPTIMAVNGLAVGAGASLTLPADVRIAAESAKYGMFFVRMGLVPEMGASALLPQLVGVARAVEWALSARFISAQEALEAGLVREVVPDDQLIDRAVEIAEEMGKWPGTAQAEARRLILENVHMTDMVAVMEREGEAVKRQFETWEHREAIAAFVEKRPADFTNPK